MPVSEAAKTNGTAAPSPSPTVALPDEKNAFGLLAALAVSSAAGGSYGSLKESLRAAISSDPFDATVVTVLGGAFLFYVAEKGNNPKVETYWDALVFISTCLSVGYADIFARTPAGQAIASAVMTLGPAMSGAILDPVAAKEPGDKRVPDELFKVQTAIVDKLDAILGELRAARTKG
jgi:voltage-gated potassium channel